MARRPSSERDGSGFWARERAPRIRISRAASSVMVGSVERVATGIPTTGRCRRHDAVQNVGRDHVKDRIRGSCGPTSHPARIPVTMSAIGLAAVNVATPTFLADLQGERVWSGVAKHPVAASAVLWLSTLNLSG